MTKGLGNAAQEEQFSVVHRDMKSNCSAVQTGLTDWRKGLAM